MQHVWRARLWVLVSALCLQGCPTPPAPPDAGPPPAPVPVEPPDAGPPPTPFDAGPPDAGPVDAGPVDAGPVDAGPVSVDAGAKGAKVVDEPVIDDPDEVKPVKRKHLGKLRAPKEALGRLVHDCFEEAAKIHWGPQQVTVKATLDEQEGEGQFQDGTVLRGSLHDAKSNACFVRALDEARFKLGANDSVDQEVTYMFDYVPGVKR